MTREKGVTLRADWGSRKQFQTAKWTVEKERCPAVWAVVVLIIHGRSTGRADRLPTIIAKAIFQV
jgi:hypothetical protein